jgi:hypothetical protein
MTGSRPAGLSTADTTRTRRTRVRPQRLPRTARPSTAQPSGRTPPHAAAANRSGEGRICGVTAAFVKVAAMPQPPDIRPAAADTRQDRPTARVCRSGRRPRPSRQLIGGRDLRCPRQDGTCPRRRSAVPQLPDTARSGRNCGHGSRPPGPAWTAWALLHERRTVNPLMVPARYNLLYSSSRPALRGRRLRRPPSRRQHTPWAHDPRHSLTCQQTERRITHVPSGSYPREGRKRTFGNKLKFRSEQSACPLLRGCDCLRPECGMPGSRSRV